MNHDVERDESRSLRRGRFTRAVAGLSALAIAGSIALTAGSAGATTYSGSTPAGGTINVTTGPAANNIIIGSGSSTTYNMMTSLDSLYNQAPGCTAVVDYTSANATQPLDFSCLLGATMTAGKNLVKQTAQVGVTPNPYNDVAVEETPIGSSNGILQLETAGGSLTAIANKYNYTGTTSYNLFPGVNYARSSRSLSNSATGDVKGLNFVAYAKDGVSWVHYKQVNGNANVPSNVTGNRLSLATLTAIWKGQIQGWEQLGTSVWTTNNPGKHAPIYVFTAQEGSGTQSTWKGAIGTDPSGSVATGFYANCFNSTGTTLAAATFANAASQCDGPISVFENETSSLSGPNALSSVPLNLKDPNYPADQSGATSCATVSGGTSTQCTLNSATVYGLGAGATNTSGVYTLTAATQPTACTEWYLGCTSSGTGSSTVWTFTTPTAGAVMSRLIFFYSAGLWQHQCANTVGNSVASCANAQWIQPIQNSAGQTIFDLGAIGNGGVVSPSGVTASGCTASSHANDLTPCLPTEVSILDGDFPVTRYLYNVYSDGSQTLIPTATGAALNYVSETGFLCTTSTKTETDPLTGQNYLTEIQNTILSSGFFPLSGGAAGDSANPAGGTVDQTALDEGSVPHPASAIYTNTNPYYNFLQPASMVGSDPAGYCSVTSTDNASSTVAPA